MFNFYTGLPNLCKSDDRRRSYDVILILQDGGHSVANLFPVADLATSHMSEGSKLSAYQISTRYLNPRPRYFYFRFLKTNGRHLEILVLVSILTFPLPSACDSHWPTKCYANRMTADGVMTSYWFYKMPAIASQIYFRFLVWPPATYRKAQGYQRTKFSSKYLNPRREITICGFWKQTAATFEILLPVSTLALLLPLACGFPSGYQISAKSDYLRQSYGVIAIFKMAAVSHVGFGLGQW